MSSFFRCKGSLGLALLSLTMGSCSSKPSEHSERENNGKLVSDVPRLVAELGESVETLKGHSWRKDRAKPSAIAAVTDPRIVTIKARDRPLLTSWSKATILEQSNGRISFVNVLPLPEALKLPKTVASIERQLLELNHAGVAAIVEEIQRWSDDPKSVHASGGGFFPNTQFIEGTNLLIELRRQQDSELWFYSIGIEDVELRGRLPAALEKR